VIDFDDAQSHDGPMSTVEVVRGGTDESRHRVSVAVCDASGRTVARIGRPDPVTFYRSAAKPLQALPLVEDGVVERFGLTPEELAVCCASHEGEARHVAGARSILRKAGAGEDLLRCGPHAPYSAAAAAALVTRGEAPAPIHNNCSGKHAGMIALAMARGWDPTDYHEAAHPVQRRMIDEVVRWSGQPRDQIPTGVDGCGVVCFAVPLSAMAMSFAAFASAAAAGEPATEVVQAMTRHPFMVGGTGRTCTDVMAAGAGRVFVKLGAEGVYGGGLPDRGLGFAIKVEDGGRRAVEVALVRVLECLDVFSGDAVRALSPHGRPQVRNTRGEVVGEIRPAFDLPVGAGAGA
jgi:L-asparaginase II